LAWQQANVTLEAGKYTRLNVATASYITGYAGEIVIEYKGGGNVNSEAGNIKDHASGEIVKSITLTGKSKTHLIGRVINADNPIHLKFDGNGELLFREASADGFIPVGSHAEFQLIAGNGQNKKYRQEINLDLMNVEWTPVQDDGYYFTGEFDGAGKEISNLKITQGGQDYQGLFRRNQGIIRDVYIASGEITADNYIGGICGQNLGQIISCTNAATVSGGYYVGGVAGYNEGGVIACYNTGAVTGTYDYVGGVVGRNWDGAVTACYNTGAVKGSFYVGGVVGDNTGAITVTACYNTGAVEGTRDVGGVVGYNSSGSAVIACYNTGVVTGTGSSSVIGGVVGINYGTVTACYNTGVVTGNGNNVGGVLGVNSSSATVTACYWESATATKGIGGGTGTVDGVNPFTLPDYFAPTGSAAWNTGTNGEDGYWKAGTTDGSPLPQLWFE
jgi:hypothetical protein